MFHMPIDVDTFNRKSPASVHNSPSARSGYDLNFFESCSPISTRSNSRDIPDGPIAHAQLQLAIPIGNEMPPLCHSNGTTMRHSEVWGLRDIPAASPNYAPSEDWLDIVLIGFVRNEGAERVDFPITDRQGTTHQPDYIQVVMTYDLFVMERHPHYDPSDLYIFKTYDPHHAETDALVRGLEDQSVIAKVHRWRKLMTERAKLERNMQRVLQSVHDTGMEQEWIQIRMEAANLLARLDFMRQLHHPRCSRRS